jgi:hypothetical protein
MTTTERSQPDESEGQRLTATMDEEFVVFVVGMRVGAYWNLHRWLPVALAMPRMLRELDADDDSGLLNYELALSGRTVLVIQYWDSFEALREYARDAEREHVSAWRDYESSVGRDADVGIFHETYVVDPADCETLYDGVPSFGLGAAGDLRPATGSNETAGRRIGRAEDDPTVEAGRTDGFDGGLDADDGGRRPHSSPE